MMRMFLAASAALAIAASVPTSANADKLDDIIASGTLRCAVVLDFPPMGSRDASNNPVGFDVDTCNDLAKALGVQAEIVETPFPDRIPALISGRADVGVASTSDTLERAKTIGFSIPYFAFQMVVLTKDGLGIDNFEGLKGKTVGSVAGTYEAIALEKNVKEWAVGEFRPYQSQADVMLALSQGQIEGTVVTSTVAAATIETGQYAGFAIKGNAPYDIDYVSLITLREEYGLINYLNLFVNHQVRGGRYKELFAKYFEGEPVDLTMGKVYY